MEDACLYVGRVMHHRIRPKRHRFVYRHCNLLIDVDRLSKVDRRLRLFSVDRFNLISFHNRDHGPRDGSPLRPWIEAELNAAGFGQTPARICLLAMPRFLGYVFNPLSLYYCYCADDRLFAMVHEVKNTFGEQHAYVLAVPPTSTASKRFDQTCSKNFYVSPFIQPEATYRFSLNDPDDNVDVRISETVESKPLLVATLQGKRRALTDREILIQSFRHPFTPQKVITSIHYEALKLWLKGISLHPRPVGKPRSSLCPTARAKIQKS